MLNMLIIVMIQHYRQQDFSESLFPIQNSMQSSITIHGTVQAKDLGLLTNENSSYIEKNHMNERID